MKYTTDWIENKKVTVNGVEKDIKEGNFTDEAGNKVTATLWRFDKDNVEFPNWENIAPGTTLEANPWSKPGSDKITLYPAKATTGGNKGAGMMAMKEKAIASAQERKERSIHAAQDRSALMWAKYGACEIIAHHPSYKFITNDLIPQMIEDLATEIYNMEPNKPFN